MKNSQMKQLSLLPPDRSYSAQRYRALITAALLSRAELHSMPRVKIAYRIRYVLYVDRAAAFRCEWWTDLLVGIREGRRGLGGDIAGANENRWKR
jgi:hypothetical protein